MGDVEKQEILIGVIKGGISAIPIAGGLLNEAIFEIRGRIKQKRFNDFVETLTQRIQRLEEGLIDEDLVKSEEFGDIFESVLKEVTSKKMHQNIFILADITVESMKDSKILEHPLLDLFVKIIASLTSAELAVLRKLRPYNKANQSKISKGEKEIDFKLDYSGQSVLDLEKNLFRVTFDSLLSKGLVIDDTIGRWGGGQRDFIKPSHLGIELFKLLDEVDKQN